MEQKHESDLTAKEKRQLEREKIKSLGFKARIEYLWTYYKIWLLALAGVAAVIHVGISIYQTKHENVLAGVGIVDNAAIQDIKPLEQEIKRWLQSEGKNDVVKIYSGIMETDEGISTQMTLSTWLAAQEIDVLICPKNVYEKYRSLQFFVDMEKVLGDQAEQYKELIRGDVLVLKNTDEMRQKLGVPYDEVYVAVTVNGQNQENAGIIVKKLLESFSF